MNKTLIKVGKFKENCNILNELWLGSVMYNLGFFIFHIYFVSKDNIVTKSYLFLIKLIFFQISIKEIFAYLVENLQYIADITLFIYINQNNV